MFEPENDDLKTPPHDAASNPAADQGPLTQPPSADALAPSSDATDQSADLHIASSPKPLLSASLAGNRKKVGGWGRTFSHVEPNFSLNFQSNDNNALPEARQLELHILITRLGYEIGSLGDDQANASKKALKQTKLNALTYLRDETNKGKDISVLGIIETMKTDYPGFTKGITSRTEEFIAELQQDYAPAKRCTIL